MEPAPVAGLACTPPGLAGSMIRCTEFDLLCQTQPVPPLRITSVSPSGTGRASRKWAGSEYQSLIVCDPDSIDSSDDGSCCPGSWGMPSAADSTTVPLICGGVAAWLASAEISWAGLRAGRAGEAAAAVAIDAAVTAATTATAPAGTAHRARRGGCDVVGMSFMATSHSLRPGRDTPRLGYRPPPERDCFDQAMPTWPSPRHPQGL